MAGGNGRDQDFDDVVADITKMFKGGRRGGNGGQVPVKRVPLRITDKLASAGKRATAKREAWRSTGEGCTSRPPACCMGICISLHTIAWKQ